MIAQDIGCSVVFLKKRCSGSYTRRRKSRWAINGQARAREVYEMSGLGSLSYFMQALNQPIAIAANKEEECTGKFWEGRYKCQRLTDDSAVLSAMTYVDLNPIRAGMAEDLPSSDHTTAQLRTQRIDANKRVASFGLKPVAGLCQQQLLDMTEATYLSLVDWSGRLLHPGKTGKIADSAPPILAEMGLAERRWEGQVRGTESIYWRAIGGVDSLLDLTEQLGQKWLRGMRAVMELESPD